MLQLLDRERSKELFTFHFFRRDFFKNHIKKMQRKVIKCTLFDLESVGDLLRFFTTFVCLLIRRRDWKSELDYPSLSKTAFRKTTLIDEQSGDSINIK